jgi:hypothetical protein
MSYKLQEDIAGSLLHAQKVHGISGVVSNCKQWFPTVFLSFEDSPKKTAEHVKGQVLFSQSRLNKGKH